ncbi:hypothetical protein H500_02085 [Helicobacter pylori CG-IMSS-2012]|nr:hypothetical protein H500_02085 [Helicobacter pylori CG-IMSS-2012]
MRVVFNYILNNLLLFLHVLLACARVRDWGLQPPK